MAVDETLELARSYNVEVRLNEAGDGLNLEVEADPPQALINVLRRTKWDIVAALRQREIERRRPLITRWINEHFVSTPLGVCRHCGEARGKETLSSTCTAVTTRATSTPPVSRSGRKLRRPEPAPPRGWARWPACSIVTSPCCTTSRRQDHTTLATLNGTSPCADYGHFSQTAGQTKRCASARPKTNSFASCQCGLAATWASGC
jgi:hypothetical protein